MKINKLLTKTNYRREYRKINKYIVIHYVGATGGAEANCKYFYSTYRGASAHYFVGHSGEVWQCVEDKNTSWHCGANRYVHPYCRNSNSIGIELCCKKDKSGQWYFEEATVKAAIELTKELMKKYNIPVANVLRHYDVSAKNCPEPYVRDKAAWIKFKNSLLTVGAKSNEDIAKEVLKGLWGNGADRQNKLKAAGYDYKAIQTIVNKLLKGNGANKS